MSRKKDVETILSRWKPLVEPSFRILQLARRVLQGKRYSARRLRCIRSDDNAITTALEPIEMRMIGWRFGLSMFRLARRDPFLLRNPVFYDDPPHRDIMIILKKQELVPAK